MGVYCHLSVAQMGHLISLEQHNAEISASVADPILDVPRKNGIRCVSGKCGAELYDSHPHLLLKTDPPTKAVHCVKCGFRGSRLA